MDQHQAYCMTLCTACLGNSSAWHRAWVHRQVAKPWHAQEYRPHSAAAQAPAGLRCPERAWSAAAASGAALPEMVLLQISPLHTRHVMLCECLPKLGKCSCPEHRRNPLMSLITL